MLRTLNGEARKHGTWSTGRFRPEEGDHEFFEHAILALAQKIQKTFRGATHILALTTMMSDRFQLTGKCQTDLSYHSRAKVSSCFTLLGLMYSW